MSNEAFEKWWDSPTYAVTNNYKEDSPIYWADIAWQAAQADQAERVKELEFSTERANEAFFNLCQTCAERDGTIEQLQLENQKLRDALEVCKYDRTTAYKLPA